MRLPQKTWNPEIRREEKELPEEEIDDIRLGGS